MKSEKILKVGNYVIEKKKDDDFEYVVVSPVSGNMSVWYRSDSEMFSIILMLCEKKFREFLENWLTIMYICFNSAPDLELLNDSYLMIEKYIKRREKMMDAQMAEDDARALDEVRKMEEMKNENLN